MSVDEVCNGLKFRRNINRYYKMSEDEVCNNS